MRDLVIQNIKDLANSYYVGSSTYDGVPYNELELDDYDDAELLTILRNSIIQYYKQR